jgi:hypothetical protein
MEQRLQKRKLKMNLFKLCLHFTSNDKKPPLSPITIRIVLQSVND